MLFVRELYTKKREQDHAWENTYFQKVLFDDGIEDVKDGQIEGHQGREEEELEEEMPNEVESVPSAHTVGRVNRNIITVLDRLQDDGVHLTRLALCMEFAEQWVSENVDWSST